jgi:hypothetical protein
MAVLDEREVGNALTNRTAGRTRIVGVRVRYGEDSDGDPALFVKLMLSDPPAGMDTWPVEDVWELRRAVRDVITGLEPQPNVAWFISFVPESAEELEPDDLAGEVEIDLDA